MRRKQVGAIVVTMTMTMTMTMMMTLGAGAQVATQTVNVRGGSAQDRSGTEAHYPADSRPYLVKFADDGQQEGDWREGKRMRAYAEQHAGSYIVFVSDGAMYRLDNAERLHEVEPLYTAMVALGKQQAALGEAQRPLAEQQRSLGEVQRGTTNAAAQGEIGAVQGSVGKVQGEIGRQQGEIGRQQGVLGRAFYKQVQGFIDACLQDKSCVVVEAKPPV